MSYLFNLLEIRFKCSKTLHEGYYVRYCLLRVMHLMSATESLTITNHQLYHPLTT